VLCPWYLCRALSIPPFGIWPSEVEYNLVSVQTIGENSVLMLLRP
jgi:hypothetical protein